MFQSARPNPDFKGRGCILRGFTAPCFEDTTGLAVDDVEAFAFIEDVDVGGNVSE